MSVVSRLKPRICEHTEWFANRSMRVCVDGTANQCCAMHGQFAYRLPRTKICWFFARTQRELDAVVSFHAPSVLCSHQVCGKFINRAPNTRRTWTVQRVSGALVYTRFKEAAVYVSKSTNVIWVYCVILWNWMRRRVQWNVGIENRVGTWCVE